MYSVIHTCIICTIEILGTIICQMMTFKLRELHIYLMECCDVINKRHLQKPSSTWENTCLYLSIMIHLMILGHVGCA